MQQTFKRMAVGGLLYHLVVLIVALLFMGLVDYLLLGGGSVLAMAALAADRITAKKMTTNEMSYPVKDATKIFAGGLVGIQADGHAVPGADAAAIKIVGVAKSTVDNSAGADGDKRVNVEEGLFLFPATSITQAMVGQMMYVVDDQTFDDTLGTNGVKAGRLLEFVSTTSGWIFVAPSGVGCVLADGSDLATTQALANNLKSIINKWLS